MARKIINERELNVRLALMKYFERKDGYCYFKKDDYRNLSIFTGEKSIIESFKYMEDNSFIKNETINGYVSRYKILVDGIKCYDFLLNKKLKISEMSLLYFLALNHNDRDKITSSYVCKLCPSYKTKTASNVLSSIRRVLDIEYTLRNLNEVYCQDDYLTNGYTKTTEGIFYGSFKEVKKCRHCGEVDNNSFSFKVYGVCKKCACNIPVDYSIGVHKVLFKKYKNSSRVRNLEFSINEDIILDLLNMQNYKCYYSGLDFNLSDVNGSPTIDRIDSSKGYIVGNIVIARNDVNKMKSNYSFEHFKMLVNSVSKKIGGIEGVCL